MPSLGFIDSTFAEPQGEPIMLDLQCSGSETNLLDCVNETIVDSISSGSGNGPICNLFAIARCRKCV